MIGIFDSGVGGMTVARAVEKLLPEYQHIYFGDLARSPYGSKSAATITRYAEESMAFLASHGAKAIIIACNSAASVATETLRKNSEIPVFEVITPAIDQALATTLNGRIGVIGTRATVRSGIYEEKIKQMSPHSNVFSYACPLLVPLVEEGWVNKRETKMIVRRYLQPLKLKQIDTLVLGCTHYPLLKDLISQRLGRNKVALVDSSLEVAKTLKDFLEENQAVAETFSRGGPNLYYVSDITEAALATAEKIFGRKINLQRS